MKTTKISITLGAMILLSLAACKKNEITGEYAAEQSADMAVATTDSISNVASMTVKDKQFIKTANVDMEVKDVYNATIAIENSAKKLEGFVTHSNLKSQIISEEKFNTSDTEAMLIKKYQSENSMQVRIPTLQLATFLQEINNQKVFLNARIINAEEVTANIKFAELEAKRIKKTDKNISEIKKDDKKVNLDNDNMSDENNLKLASLNITDQLKYSTVDIYIKEPQTRVAEIAVTNTTNIDNQYKFNFWYDIKNAFVEGFYLIQTILVFLVKIWPLVLIGMVITYFIRRKKVNLSAKNPNILDT